MKLEEFILKESIIDIPHKYLCKDIFESGYIRSDIKKKLIDTFEDWKKEFIPKLEKYKMFLLGSITTYQYNDTSDVDVNIVCNLPPTKISEIYKFLPGNFYIKKHQVNYYISPLDSKDVAKSPTLFDMLENKWIRKPDKNITNIPEEYAYEIAKFFMDGVDLRISEYERDKKDLEKLRSLKDNPKEYNYSNKIAETLDKKEFEVKADVDAIKTALHLLKAFRYEGFTEDKSHNFLFKIEVKSNDNPNLSMNNIIYKILEKYGYLDKMKEFD